MKRVGIYLFRSIKILSGAACAFLIFVITTDTGKNLLLNAASFIAKTNYSIDIQFSKLSDNHISEIIIKRPQGAMYHIKDFNFHFSPKINIAAGSVTITTDQKGQKTDYTKLITKIKNVLPFLRRYIQSAKIKKINNIQNFKYINLNDSVQCLATISGMNISILLQEKCTISVKNQTQEFFISLYELSSNNISFDLKSSTNLISAKGSMASDFSNLSIQGTFKGRHFKSNAVLVSDIVNFTANISDIVPSNKYIPTDTIIKSDGVFNLSSKAFDIGFAGYSKDKLLFTGSADNINNTINSSIKWNGWHVTTNLTINKNILNINALNVEHSVIKAYLTVPIIINLQKHDSILDRIDSGKIDYEFVDINRLKDIAYSNYFPKGSGTGYIQISNNELLFNVKSENLLYNDLAFRECNGQYSSNNNFRISFEDIMYKNHKISNLSIAKDNSNLRITGTTNNDKIIDINAQLSKDKAIVNLFNINAKDINISADKIEILRHNKELSITSDNLKLFDGTASVAFKCNSNAKQLKLKASNLSLKKLLFFSDKTGKKLARKFSISTNIDVSTSGNKCVGMVDLDILNDKGYLVLNSRIKLLNSGIFVSGKYADIHDFIEASMFVPVYLSDQLEINKIDNQKFSGSINASINLRKFLLFSITDRLTLKGQLETQLSISEAKNSAVINGACSLSNGAVETPTVSIKNIFINASVNNNKITLNKAISSHKKGKMSITGGGRVVIDDVVPQVLCDMDVTFNNFDLLSSDSLNCNFTGKVKATGPVQNLTLKGPLTVTHGIYDTSHTEPSYHSDIQVKGLKKQPQKTSTLEDSNKIQAPFIFDIDGKCKDFRVTGKSIEATLNGGLRVLTFNDALTLDGDLQLGAGYINMVGVRVKLRSGFVKFKKERGVSPLVSLHGNSIVKDMQIFLDIDNIKNDHLTIDIRSNPTYSIENIFSKIVFNKPLIGLKVDESAKIRNAVKSLKQESSTSFSYFDFLKELMIFDSFSFSNDDTANAKNGGSVLNAGKYISDNIYIGVEKATEKEAKYKVAVNLSPQVRVEANSNGEAGVTWMYRY